MGFVTGAGYDSNGNLEFSIAGAAGSNDWGFWTETFSNGASGSPSNNCVPGSSGCFNVPIDPCANATLSATGVDIHQNMRDAYVTVALPMTMSAAFGNRFAGLVGALYGYGQLVGTGGPQDVKNERGPGTRQQRVDAGNISFGVTCPFGSGFCQFSAGLAQTLSGNPNFHGTLQTGFDTPSDNNAIRIGQAMRAAGCHE